MLEYGIMKPYSNISCFSTTRHGGYGEGAYATFNCTHYCGDNPEHVKGNLEFVKGFLASSKTNQDGHVDAIVIPRQTHTTNVQVIENVPSEEELQDVDAVVTNLKGYCLCVSTADCVPILIYDPVKQVIAAVHAGWRGTVGRIVEKTLETMINENPAWGTLEAVRSGRLHVMDKKLFNLKPNVRFAEAYEKLADILQKTN